jgi:ribosomal protein S27E
MPSPAFSLSLVRCRVCGHQLGFEENGKLKIRVPGRLIAVSSDGTVDLTCPNCKSETKIPLRFTARVAQGESEQPPA